MLDCIDEIACHSESQELGKDPALEKFRTLTRILQNHLSFIYPACVDDASIELKTFNHFISNGIVSESSDEVLTVERRIAKNLSQYLDLASDDEDEELAQLPPKEVSIYADLQSLNALKWMVSIVDEMLEIYLYVQTNLFVNFQLIFLVFHRSVAKTIYEIRYVDVMEISTFLGKVTCQYTDSFAKQWTGKLLMTVKIE